LENAIWSTIEAPNIVWGNENGQSGNPLDISFLSLYFMKIG